MKNKPLIRMPQNNADMESLIHEASRKIKILQLQEMGLKEAYKVGTKNRESEIKGMRQELKNYIKDLARFQRENRTSRRKLAKERTRLSYDLYNLKDRYAYFIRYQRAKTMESPGDVINRMHEEWANSKEASK